MSIVIVISGDYCHGADVSAELSKKLGFKIVDDEVYAQAEQRFKMSRDTVDKTISDRLSTFAKIGHEREKNTARLRLILSEFTLKDDFILSNWLGHLIPRDITHALKVCVIANLNYRIENLAGIEDLPAKKASKTIHKIDQEMLSWTRFLFDKPPFDESLYDIFVPMHETPVEEAAGLIIKHAKYDAVRTTRRSQNAAEDFQLAAKARLALAEAGHDTEVTAEDGVVTIIINEYTVRLEKVADDLTEIVSKVDGVKEIFTKTGKKFTPPPIISFGDLDKPSKVLLVDDEKEFVHTLSERLLTRNFDSSIVYDGEQAIDFIKRDEPEVMVLDLKMPGIDGLEVLRRVKREHPQVEVIILTGHGSDKEENLANELGAFAYLQKPVNIDLLAQTMKNAYAKIKQNTAGSQK